jgi:hypothetical protein
MLSLDTLSFMKAGKFNYYIQYTKTQAKRNKEILYILILHLLQLWGNVEQWARCTLLAAAWSVEIVVHAALER